MTQSLFSGTSSMLRFMLRRDRVRLTIWVLAISLSTILLTPYYADMCPTAQDLQIMAESMKNPAAVMLCGPVYSANNYHYGAMMSNNTLVFMAVIVAVMNIFLISRHTRQDEETGRMELTRSLPVGKLSSTLSAMLLAVACNLILTVVIGLGITAYGIDTIDFAGSMVFACALGAVGIFSAMLTAVCCQITANNRTAVGLAMAITGTSYLLRGIGDAQGISVLAVTSPFGLAHMGESYISNYWWPNILILAAGIVLGVTALRLGCIRDLGAGLIPAKAGRKAAAVYLNGPLGLALRLLRSSVIAWLAVVIAFCAVFGSLFGDFNALVAANDLLSASFDNAEYTIIEQFMTLIMALLAIISTIPSVSFMMKLRGEEKHGHTEHILSRSVGKCRLFTGNFIPALLNAPILFIAGTISLWVIASATIDNVPALGTMLSASLYYLPATWVSLGICAALIGLFPKISGIAYGYLGYCAAVTVGVMMFGFPDWFGNISAFAYIPQIPVEAASPAAFIALTAIAAILSVIGFVGYRKRDAVFF